jgi:hypothetical protein
MKPLDRCRYLRDINVEEVFTFLSERSSTSTISTSLKNYFQGVWASLLKALAKTFRRFKANRETHKLFRAFSGNLLRARDAIVSFNYDTIIEDSLSKRYCYVGIRTKKRRISICKPHGSVNWVLNKQGHVKVSKTQTAGQPVIVAPTHLKFIGMKQNPTPGYLDQHHEINTVWQEMEKQMKKSKMFVFIGYSFPDADLYFSSVLRSVLTTQTSKVDIVLVNPDAMRIAEKLAIRFNIKKEHIQSHFNIETFSQLKRSVLFSKSRKK